MDTALFLKLSKFVNEFQSAVYDTGWYSGAIEHGRKDLDDAQRDAIYARITARKALLDAIQEALEAK